MKAAILVCTRNRPKGLHDLVGSINRLHLPPTLDVVICIADNNDEPQLDGYVGHARELARFTTLAAHEPVKGYASARNRALLLGLESGADILAFCDDDDTIDENWLTAHVTAMEEFVADLVCGPLRPQAINSRGEGEEISNVRKRIGTGNLSMRRAVVEASGAGLRFNTDFNLSGGEDTAFFEWCREADLRIVWSNRPIIHRGEPDWHEDADAAFAYHDRFAELRRRKQRNRMADASNSGAWGKMAALIADGFVQAAKGLVLLILAIVIQPLSRVRGLKLKVAGRRALNRFIGTIQGISGTGEAREAE